MSFSIGIIGLPNVGKSTLFKALTRQKVDISNFPFCTIQPNLGVVKVPDERLDKLTQILKPDKVLPTTIEFVDIAGLVKDSHKGEGLGNQFLAHIREVKAIAHVVRAFNDPNIAHLTGKIDPLSDIEIVNLELVMADLATVTKRLEGIKGRARSGDKELTFLLEVLEKLKVHLNEGKMASKLNLTEKESFLIQDLQLLTLKPMIYVWNVTEEEIKNGPSGEPASATTKWPLRGAGLGDNKIKNLSNNALPISAKLEAELADLPLVEAREFMKEMRLSSSLDSFIKASYKLLDLITFFTCQNKILQAWTLSRETKAPEAAGRIHTDFERGFIKAEVINWQDLVKIGSEKETRRQGLRRLEGKEYTVQDGDVIHFRFAI